LTTIYRFFNKSEIEYELKNESGENENLSFILTEEDFRNQTFFSESLTDWIFSFNYVMASIEDTDIATINENSILGKKKGTTMLRLYIDNQVFVYRVNVK